ERQQDTLGEQLTNETGAAGTERQANGNLLLPRGCTREQQSSHVRTGDQHDQTDECHQHVQGSPEEVAKAGPAGRSWPNRESGVLDAGSPLRGERWCDRRRRQLRPPQGQGSCSLIEGDSGSWPSQNSKPDVARSQQG